MVPLLLLLLLVLLRVRVMLPLGVRLRRLFQDSRPVELHVGIVLLEQTDGVLVDRRASDPDAGRRTKPIKDAVLAASFAPRIVDERCRLVPAAVAVETQMWQTLLPFLRTRRLASGRGCTPCAFRARGGRGLSRRPCFLAARGRTLARSAVRLDRLHSFAGLAGFRFRTDGRRRRSLDEREARLIADRVEAPELRHVHLILCDEAPRDFDDARGHVQMKGRAHAAEVRPLRHRLEMIDGLPGFDLDDPFEPLPLVRRRQHEIRKHLTWADLDAGGLLLPYVDGHVVPPFQSSLQQPDNPIVFELFANRSHQDGAHGASRRSLGFKLVGRAKITRNGSRSPRLKYRGTERQAAQQLDADLFWLQNDAVIAAADPPTTRSDTRTILIVDDDRSVADTFARMLKLEGFNVATALNAETGLELADSVRPDAIILDMRMPITNGLQFLRLIRAKPQLVEVPIAIVTGDYFLPDPLQLEIKSLGASIRFKPMWLEDLIALAKTLVPA